MGLTHFPYGVSSFGIPLPASSIPGLFNNDEAPFPRRYLFVDGTNGNDANTGFDTIHAKKTIQAAVDTRLPGDCIVIARATYAENVVISRYFAGVSNAPGALWLVGVGAPRAAAAIAPATGIALTNNEIDVTVVNMSFNSPTAAAQTILNTGRRFRMYACKAQGADTSGTVLELLCGQNAAISSPNWTQSDSSDCYFTDCEFAWGFNGVKFVGSDFGAVTQVLFERCRFHNNSNATFIEGVGVGGSASVTYRNIEIVDCFVDRMEDGTQPTFYCSLDASNSNTGIVTRTSWPCALLTAGKTAVSTALIWVSNYHTGGVSNAQPT